MMDVSNPTEFVMQRRQITKSMMAVALALLAPRMSFAGAYDDYFKAVKFNDVDVVKALLARGLDPNIIEPQRGDTGMILALREDAIQVFNVLLETPGIDLEIKARNGDTALMIACYKGNRRAVEALLSRGAEVNRPGWTPLHYAAAAGNNDIVKLLLDESAYIDAESPNKTTPIMMAALGNHILTVKLLLDEGADATLRNELGLSAIDIATMYGFNDIAEGLTYRLKKAGKLK
jgi:ankyrin repeat protein